MHKLNQCAMSMRADANGKLSTKGAGGLPAAVKSARMKNTVQAADRKLADYYRLEPASLGCATVVGGGPHGETGFFQFGGQVCYGRCQSGSTSDVGRADAFDASKHVAGGRSTLQLPFSFAETVDNLRLERYRAAMDGEKDFLTRSKLLTRSYYFFRRGIPLSVRRRMQRIYLRNWSTLPFPAWPVDCTVDRLHQELLRLLMETSGTKKVPFIWFWPHGASSCLIMTHDVESAAGRDFAFELLNIDASNGFRSSFQVIPEKRYKLSDEYAAEIRRRGFELNIHDLNHDGHLYRDRREFVSRAAAINSYIRKYGAHGFRAGSMHRRQDWYEAFQFSYDMSVPNVAHLEPMRGGCCTVMPYFVGAILELPLTTAEDYSLFHILQDYSLDVWKQQIHAVLKYNGLLSFLAHPDYLIEHRARQAYENLLRYLRKVIAKEHVWEALPGEVNEWWRARAKMKLIAGRNGWEIVGPSSERARLAYATLKGGQVAYELADTAPYDSALPQS